MKTRDGIAGEDEPVHGMTEAPVQEGSLGEARLRQVAAVGLGLVLVAVTAFLFPGVVLRGEVFYERDVHLVWYGQVESFVRAVRGGSWPLWDPYVSFGHPMLANPNTQTLYPPTYINLLLVPESAYVVLVFAHLVFGGVGLVLFARGLGQSRGAALASAIAWIASGPFLSLVNVWHHLAGAAWVPWVFLAADRALVRPSLRGAAILGGAVGMQLLAGSPDLSGFTGAALVAYTLSLLEWRRPFTLANGRRLAGAALALLFALGIAAAQLLPTLEATRRSSRWSLDPSFREHVGSLHPLGLLAKVLSPLPLGDLPFDPAHAGPLLDEGMPFLRSLYLGLPAVALVLAAFRGPGTGRGRGFFALLAGGAILFALGPHTPVYATLVALFPFLGTLRYPSKAMALAAFAWSILLGLGIDRWRRPGAAPTRGWILGVSLPLALALLIVAALGQSISHPPGLLEGYLLPEKTLGRPWGEAMGGSAWAFGAAVLLGAFVLAASLVPRPSKNAAWAVAILTATDLVIAGSRVNRTTSREFYRYRPSLLDATNSEDLSRLFVRSYPETRPLEGLENPYKIAWYPRGLSLDAGRALGARLALMPPVSAVFGLFASYEPDLLGLYPRYLTDISRWVKQAEGTPAYVRLLELGAVGRVAALEGRGLEDLALEKELKTPLVLPLRLWKVRAPMPRTFVVGDAKVADDELARSILEDPAFDPRREVVLADGTARRAPPDFAGTSRVVEFRADQVALEATATAPGFVVLVDTFDPGWKASVDGGAAPVYRANGAFRAVSVPAGRHLIEMRYRPARVAVGLLVSALTGLAGLAIVLGRRRGRRGPDEDQSASSAEGATH